MSSIELILQLVAVCCATGAAAAFCLQEPNAVLLNIAIMISLEGFCLRMSVNFMAVHSVAVEIHQSARTFMMPTCREEIVGNQQSP